MDQLEIIALRTKTHIGVHAWEQRILQDLVFDIYIPIENMLCLDKLEHTIDYDALCQAVVAFVEARSFKLIETVAESVATLIKTEFPRVTTLTIRVSKPHAVPAAGNIGITITR
jgi:dihydroneopterin aldolase